MSNANHKSDIKYLIYVQLLAWSQNALVIEINQF